MRNANKKNPGCQEKKREKQKIRTHHKEGQEGIPRLPFSLRTKYKIPRPPFLKRAGDLGSSN